MIVQGLIQNLKLFVDSKVNRGQSIVKVLPQTLQPIADQIIWFQALPGHQWAQSFPAFLLPCYPVYNAGKGQIV